MSEIIASITPRRGAYLISFDHAEPFTDSTPAELYDCASSLNVARRSAKREARDAGCTHLHWVPGPERGYHPGTWLLIGDVGVDES